MVKEVRARGLFIGVEFKTGYHVDGNTLTKIMMKNGLLTKATHDMTVRFTPALVITKPEIDSAMEVIEKSIQEMEVVSQSLMK